VADTTSLLNVGEEHLTLEREGSDLFASNRYRAFLFKTLPFGAFLSFHHLKADGYPEGSFYEPTLIRKVWIGTCHVHRSGFRQIH